MAADFARLESHRSLMLDRHCVVVGSAPERGLPVRTGPLVAIQGGQIGVGLVPDLAVFSGHTTKEFSEVAQDTMAGIRGLQARSVVFIEKGHTEGGAGNHSPVPANRPDDDHHRARNTGAGRLDHFRH